MSEIIKLQQLVYMLNTKNLEQKAELQRLDEVITEKLLASEDVADLIMQKLHLRESIQSYVIAHEEGQKRIVALQPQAWQEELDDLKRKRFAVHKRFQEARPVLSSKELARINQQLLGANVPLLPPRSTAEVEADLKKKKEADDSERELRELDDRIAYLERELGQCR